MYKIRFFYLLILLLILPAAQAKSCFQVLAELGTAQNQNISEQGVLRAAQRIYASGLVKQTPLVKSELLSERFGRNIFLKLDYEQSIGAFKIRGAVNAMMSTLQKYGHLKGVVTASSGNHAQGVALTAREFGVAATIVMAQNASALKIEKVKKLGAKVILHGNSFEEAEGFAKNYGRDHQFHFIHPFTDDEVIHGQGTIGLEITRQLREEQGLSSDNLLVIGPIGGGGLMAGVGTLLKAQSPKAQLMGVQARSNSYMLQSLLKRNDIVRASHHPSFADGAAVVLVDQKVRQQLQSHLDWLASVEEREIIFAMQELEAENVFVEGAAALSLAGLQRFPREQLPENVVLILTGKNLDPVKRKLALEQI